MHKQWLRGREESPLFAKNKNKIWVAGKYSCCTKSFVEKCKIWKNLGAKLF